MIQTPSLQQIQAAAAAVQTRLHVPPAGAPAAPKVGLILGSGLGDYALTLKEARAVPYGELPGFPPSSVVGHAGNLVFGLGPGGAPVLAMQGRVHHYEGHSLAQVAFPARVLIACGCSTLILTNAAGGIGDGLRQGQLVIIEDHLNLMGGSPLLGRNDPDMGPRFPDMTGVYDARLRALCAEVGEALGLGLGSGVYAGLCGPQYETPAEVRMLRGLGATLVGMSTVPEAIAARHMGARVLGLSCVTNLAAGIAAGPLSHDEVTETAARVRGDFMRLLDGVLLRLSQEAT